MFGTTSSSNTSQDKSHQTKPNDNFLCKHISKETSSSNPSFRVYYNGVSVAVPFIWESQPGTPKHKSIESSLPPLTPPPYYYKNHEKKPTLKSSRSNVFQLLFPRISLPKRTNFNAFTSSPNSSSASWNSSSGIVTPRKCERRTLSSNGGSFDSKGSFDVEEEVTGLDPPTSPLCFSGLRKRHYACWSL